MEMSHYHAPTALSPGKNSGSHRAGGWVGPSASLDGVEEKILCLWRDFEPRTVQHVESRYTEWASQAPRLQYYGTVFTFCARLQLVQREVTILFNYVSL